MKKVLVFVVVSLVLLVSVVGCGSAGGELKTDDFDIYENGKVVLKGSDFENSQESFASLQMYDLEGRTLETKRGIKIGSTTREVADAYKDITVGLISPSKIGQDDVTYDEFLNNQDKYMEAPADDSSWDYIVAYDIGDINDHYILNFCITGDVVENVIISAPSR